MVYDYIPGATQFRFFQYSLCRVVLMVLRYVRLPCDCRHFQYSLCRVVLMVAPVMCRALTIGDLSVLALSSRFDGRTFANLIGVGSAAFSTRSVESF